MNVLNDVLQSTPAFPMVFFVSQTPVVLLFRLGERTWRSERVRWVRWPNALPHSHGESW